MVLFSPFGPLKFYSIQFGPHSVLFSPYWFYSVHFIHFDLLQSYLSHLVHIGPFQLISLIFVLFSPFYRLWSHWVHIAPNQFGLSTSVLFDLLRSNMSTSVLFNPLVLIQSIQSYSVHLIPVTMIYKPSLHGFSFIISDY